MLKGEKPFALFWLEPGMEAEDVGDDGFEEFVKNGKISRLVDVDADTGIETRRYSLPTEEWRAKLSLLMSRLCKDRALLDTFTPDDLARMEGVLLGYSKESIEAFIMHASNFRPTERSS